MDFTIQYRWIYLLETYGSRGVWMVLGDVAITSLALLFVAVLSVVVAREGLKDLRSWQVTHTRKLYRTYKTIKVKRTLPPAKTTKAGK